jgi:hypothetical protein
MVLGLIGMERGKGKRLWLALHVASMEGWEDGEGQVVCAVRL